MYATPEDDRDGEWHDAMKFAVDDRKDMYNLLLDDKEVFLSASTWGVLRVGNIALRGMKIQPGKATELEKEWLRQAPTYHYIKLKVEGVRR